MTVISEQRSIAISVADWATKVDQNDPTVLSSFINQMPSVTIIPHDQIDVIRDTAVDFGVLKPMTINLAGGYLQVSPPVADEGLWNCFGGTHATYGNFAVFWSLRGRGNEARERPCFLFYDEQPVWLSV